MDTRLSQQPTGGVHSHIENQSIKRPPKHRMRLFQGAFHSNPDYSLWYGWSEMVRDLTDIKDMAQEIRAKR